MYYYRVWCRYRTLVVNLIAGASEGDVIVERHVSFALVKTFEVSDDCRANVASMRLRLQIDLSDEIDGVGQRVLAIRIEHRLSLACCPPVGRVMHIISGCTVVLCVEQP